MSVCLLAYLRIHAQTVQNFLYIINTSVLLWRQRSALYTSGLWMTSCFHIIGQAMRRTNRANARNDSPWSSSDSGWSLLSTTALCIIFCSRCSLGPVRPADALAYRFIGRYRRSKHRKSLTSLHAKRHLLYVSLRLLAVNCLCCKGGEKSWFKFTIDRPSGASASSYTDVVDFLCFEGRCCYCCCCCCRCSGGLW